MCWAALVYWIKVAQNPLLAFSSKVIIRPKTSMSFLVLYPSHQETRIPEHTILLQKRTVYIR